MCEKTQRSHGRTLKYTCVKESFIEKGKKIKAKKFKNQNIAKGKKMLSMINSGIIM